MLLLEAGKTVEAMKLVEFIPFIGLRARIFVAVAKRKAEAGEPMEASARLNRALEPTGQEPDPATLSDGRERVIDAQLAFGAAEATSALRSEEHTSEVLPLMRISYAVYCWTNKNTPSL